MDDFIFIITICTTALIGCAMLLIYNYKLFKNTMIMESNNNYKARCNRLIGCIEDLIGDINKKFPHSTLKYTYKDNEDIIEGNIITHSIEDLSK